MHRASATSRDDNIVGNTKKRGRVEKPGGKSVPGLAGADVLSSSQGERGASRHAVPAVEQDSSHLFQNLSSGFLARAGLGRRVHTPRAYLAEEMNRLALHRRQSAVHRTPSRCPIPMSHVLLIANDVNICTCFPVLEGGWSPCACSGSRQHPGIHLPHPKSPLPWPGRIRLRRWDTGPEQPPAQPFVHSP